MNTTSPDSKPTTTASLREKPRRDPPVPLRMIFDITPEWWGRLLTRHGSGGFFKDMLDLSTEIEAIKESADGAIIHLFLGTVREVRCSVQRVEIECIDTRRTITEAGPDFTIGGDRAILVHLLNKLHATSERGIEPHVG